jgi:Holliday junction resolvase RusA-like endonuclease
MTSMLSSIERVIESPDWILDIKMPLFSKERPRLTKGGHAYMPESYRQKQAEMKRQIREQWLEDGNLIGPLAIYIKAYGEARGDGDNITGAFLDAAGPSKGVPGVLLSDDRVSVIPLLIFDWQKSPKENSRWLVHILKLDA